MKAVCVKPDRSLEVVETPTPGPPPAEHLLVQIEASAINPGDKAYLAMILPAGMQASNAVWGASAVGRVVAIGEGVPDFYIGKPVAIYRSMRSTPDTIGLWCETAQVHHLNCLVLPEDVRLISYAGSLVNAVTAYAFLTKATEEGHKGVVVTAGRSATGLAVAALARKKNIPVIHLVRSASTRDDLRHLNAEHVLLTTDRDFEHEFAELAGRLETTAIFDGIGGDIVSRLAPHAPRNTTFYFYGFMASGVPFSLDTRVFRDRGLTMKFFSNTQTETVQDSERLRSALQDLHSQISDALFQTSIGQMFPFVEIDAAMRYASKAGARAVLLPA